jgi:hypothetical protein
MPLGQMIRSAFSRLFGREVFSETVPRPIDRMISELMAGLGKIGRIEALSVPAVRRGRDLICSLATLPVRTIDGGRRPVVTELLDGSIDPNVPDVVTFAQTYEDLMFESVSYWLKTSYDAYGYPVSARHLDYATVSANPPTGVQPHPLPSGIDPRSVFWVEGKPIPKTQLIVFQSPNPPMLRDGARTIRRAIAIDKAAELYAENPRPQDYFTPADPANGDPGDDPKIERALNQWAFWRKKRVTGYVPAALKYNQVIQPTPAELQLVELGDKATRDVANLVGVDAEDLGISTTSRTYQNDTTRRQDRVNDVLAAYAAAVHQRLSMDDVTWPGRRVLVGFDDYLKADPKTRAEIDEIKLRCGTITVEEIREREGQPAMPAQAAPALPPLRVDAVAGQPVREIGAA